MTVGTVLRAAAGGWILLAGFGIAARSVPDPDASDDLVLSGVTVVNPGGERTARAEIRIDDGRIRVIRPMRPSPGAPRRYVLPGLVDMHVHVWSERPELAGLLFLSHGVTTVRDVGDSEGTIFATRGLWDEGTLAGPRVHACGPFVDGEPAVWPGSRVPRTAAEAAATVADLERLGADCIKVYRHVAPAIVTALREAAHEHGMTVVGHVPDGMTLEGARLDDVQHLTGVPGIEAADPERPTEQRTEQWIRAWAEVSDERLDEVARLSRRLGIAHTPTLVFWQRYFRLLEPGLPTDALRAIPEAHRDEFWKPSRPWSETSAARRDARRALRRMQDAVARLHRSGVRLAIGTDALNPYNVPGETLHEEIRLFVEAGLSPTEALQIATRGAAEALGRPELGVVAEGGAADLLVFREDPTKHLSALSTLETVISRGRAHPIAELDERLDGIRDREQQMAPAALLWSRMLDGLGLREREL